MGDLLGVIPGGRVLGLRLSQKCRHAPVPESPRCVSGVCPRTPPGPARTLAVSPRRHEARCERRASAEPQAQGCLRGPGSVSSRRGRHALRHVPSPDHPLPAVSENPSDAGSIAQWTAGLVAGHELLAGGGDRPGRRPVRDGPDGHPSASHPHVSLPPRMGPPLTSRTLWKRWSGTPKAASQRPCGFCPAFLDPSLGGGGRHVVRTPKRPPGEAAVARRGGRAPAARLVPRPQPHRPLARDPDPEPPDLAAPGPRRSRRARRRVPAASGRSVSGSFVPRQEKTDV